MARLRDITPQRKQMILNFIHAYRAAHEGISPTDREISRGIGYGEKSYGTTNTMIQELIKEGWLHRAIAGSRGLIPLQPSDKEYYPIKRPDLQRIARNQKREAADM